MSDVKARQGAYRFEKFELDLRSGELRQDDGKTLRLTAQPFQILLLLLEHQGSVVTREELRKRLWPNDTIVEFEHSISAAMNRLRQALGDSANNPHYVETLARRGYRWMVPAEWRENLPARPAAVAATEINSTDENLIGKKVSHYRLLRILGGGGMGIVHEAEDLKLGRRVALKVLPEELATDPLALQRFEREAQAASALDHPNICTIHEFGEHEGKPFIVMQLLDGQTVREHIAGAVPGKTLWPIDKLLDLALQIADGLEAAHRRGIVHRDVKPANIFLTTRGEAKILDFGVAKLMEMSEPVDDGTTASASEGMQRSSSPGLTATGRSMGTASYMSPEQIRGEKLDARTDLFSFGLVLFEMATTQRPFPGDTATLVHQAILQRQETSPRQFNQDLPPRLEEIIHRCLEKDREARYHTAADLIADLQQVQREMQPTGSAFTKRRAVAMLAAALLGVMFVAGWRLVRNRAKALPPVKLIPFASYSGTEGLPAISPDGKQIAFWWNGDSENGFDIYVKQIGEAAPLRLTKSGGQLQTGPVWSPDGQHIAYMRCRGSEPGSVFVISSLGGPERKIAQSRFCMGSMDWSADGKQLVVGDKDSANEPDALFLLSLETGERRRLTRPANLEQDFQPKFSPDSKTVAFVRVRGAIAHDIYLVPVVGGQPRRLTFAETFFNGLTWTRDGREIIFTNQVGQTNVVWRVSASGGTPERLSEVIAVNASEPTAARNADRLAYRQISTNVNIWKVQVPPSGHRAGAAVKLISSTRLQDGQQFSPDGQKVVFSSDRSGTPQIWVCDSNGANASQLTSMDSLNTGSPQWSPDGRLIVFDSVVRGNLSVFLVGADGGYPRALVVDSHLNSTPSFSRDGQWIYFASDRSGEYDIWKVRVEGGPLVQVTFHSGLLPMESVDGKYVYYIKGSDMSPGNEGQLWRIPTAGREEELAMTNPVGDVYWTTGPGGIYFIDPSTKPQPTLKFFDTSRKRTSTIASLERKPACCGREITVSPDGSTILYAQVDNETTDIVVIDNFR